MHHQFIHYTTNLGSPSTGTAADTLRWATVNSANHNDWSGDKCTYNRNCYPAQHNNWPERTERPTERGCECDCDWDRVGEEECTEELNSTQLHSVWWSQDTIIDQLKVAELIQRRQHVCRESFRIYQMQLVPLFCLCTDSTAPPPPPPHWNQQCLGHGYYRHVHFITGQYIM